MTPIFSSREQKSRVDQEVIPLFFLLSVQTLDMKMLIVWRICFITVVMVCSIHTTKNPKVPSHRNIHAANFVMSAPMLAHVGPFLGFFHFTPQQMGRRHVDLVSTGVSLEVQERSRVTFGRWSGYGPVKKQPDVTGNGENEPKRT